MNRTSTQTRPPTSPATVPNSPNPEIPTRSAVQTLIEKLAFSENPPVSPAPSVDRTERIIRGVSVLREHSRNGYRYSEHAMRQAAELFEGARSFLDHDRRSVRDLAGHLLNLQLMEDDGGRVIRGDLAVVPGETGDWLLDMAEQMPRLLGMSIVARGRFDSEDGNPVVAELLVAESVDVVSDPATTRGLFEQEKRVAGEPSARPVRSSQPLDRTGKASLEFSEAAMSDWLAELLVERFGSNLLQPSLLEQLEATTNPRAFLRLLAAGLKSSVPLESPRSHPRRNPLGALAESSQPIHSALKRALTSR